MDMKHLFDVIRAIKGEPLSQDEVDAINAALAGPAPRRINAAGLALIKSFEGCELTAYKDAVGVLTIGYGSTGAHVKPGMTITLAEAEALLMNDLERFEKGVAEAAPTATGNQFSAMVSLAFNVGLGAFAGSTLLRLHKAGDHAGAQAQFARWNKAGGRVLTGLARRRAAEAALYGGKA